MAGAEIEQGRKIKKQLPPARTRSHAHTPPGPERKNQGAPLSLPIGCMKFPFSKPFVTIFGLD
jgi:hypothetical protein